MFIAQSAPCYNVVSLAAGSALAAVRLFLALRTSVCVCVCLPAGSLKLFMLPVSSDFRPCKLFTYITASS